MSDTKISAMSAATVATASTVPVVQGATNKKVAMTGAGAAMIEASNAAAQQALLGLTGGGAIALGGFTLTVPATGTAALLGIAQTFSAAQTFGSTVEIPNDTLFGRPAEGVGFLMKGYARQINMVLGINGYVAYRGDHAEYVQLAGYFRLATDAPYVLATRWDTSPCIFRVYGTYTDSSNYERLAFNTAAGAYSIKPEAAGTGTLRTLEISGLPTSSAGLASGTLWNNLGIVNVA